MRPASPIEQQDAQRTLPPAAHRADRMTAEVRSLLAEMDEIAGRIDQLVALTPHDRAEILGLVSQFRTRASAVFTEALSAVTAIKQGR
ncbi:hypothetical protein [Roseibium suaedae]|uniref:Uncharacterized protein n=1 Tax=Roseibium suaedae TaxID=735517 RepID=A0A1M7PMY4_9HYPH|nr:hypothetical protein [Roseibium suaedae]SHN18567.1 hypothetical protein SAMN05444272_4525 [Roseibium suaedae]